MTLADAVQSALAGFVVRQASNPGRLVLATGPDDEGALALVARESGQETPFDPETEDQTATDWSAV